MTTLRTFYISPVKQAELQVFNQKIKLTFHVDVMVEAIVCLSMFQDDFNDWTMMQRCGE